MQPQEAARSLEVIRTLMERTCQYQFLTARAGLIAGCLAGTGALLFNVLDPANPWHFGGVWLTVFLGSLLATCLGTVLRARAHGEPVWSRQARAVVLALAPAVFVALALSVFFFRAGLHQWLPGVWMLCYGQGALATSVYAPRPIRSLGAAALVLGCVTLSIGPEGGIVMMGLTFGLGHIWLGLTLLAQERREPRLRLHREAS